MSGHRPRFDSGQQPEPTRPPDGPGGVTPPVRRVVHAQEPTRPRIRSTPTAHVTPAGATWFRGRPRWRVIVWSSYTKVVADRIVRGPLPVAERLAEVLLEGQAAREASREPVRRLKVVDDEADR